MSSASYSSSVEKGKTGMLEGVESAPGLPKDSLQTLKGPFILVSLAI
jgi:hypothetical protein